MARTMTLPTPALEMRVPVVADVGVLQSDSVPFVVRSRDTMHDLRCSTAEHWLASYVDGKRTVADLASSSGLPQVAFWTALVQKGIVGIDG